jgi:glycosyltransferase involved in cell wall biosynthesis
MRKWFEVGRLRVDLLLYKGGRDFLPPDLRERVRVIDFGTRHNLSTLLALRRYLRTARPNVLYTTMDAANKIAARTKLFPGLDTRVFLSVHNHFSTARRDDGWYRSLRQRQAVRRLYPLADGVLCVSRGLADDMERHFGVPAERLLVVYNPSVTTEVRRMALEPVDHPWFEPGSPPVVLGVGRLAPQKDFPTLLRAFSRVRRALDCRLVILGRGDDREALLELAEELGIREQVDLPGFVSNPFAFMARAGVYVLSSEWEGCPNVLAEALGVGAPVVATDCPSGANEILQGGKCGALVAVGDVEGMADAIRKTLTGELRFPVDEQDTLPFTDDYSAREYLRVFGLEEGFHG